MENQNNIQNSTPASVNAQTADTPGARAAEAKPKRSYHRLTDEEKAQRAKEVGA